MVRHSTYQKFKNYLFLLLGIITLTVINNRSYGQTRNYATVTPSTGTVGYAVGLLGTTVNPNASGAGSITNPGNAASATSTDPAVLRANYFNLLITANEGEAWLQLKYNNPLTAGKTTYIPFDQPVTSGLSVDLLGLVGDLTGLFSKQLVVIEAYTGATAASDGTLITDPGVSTTIVKDGAGKMYFAIKSPVAYNSVRVRLRYKGNLLGLALGAALTMNVYTPFNYDADNCGSPLFTDIGQATGLNVSLTTALLNPERAVDGDLTTFSQLQSGLIGLGSTVSQTIYLNGLSSSTDVAKVILSQPGSLLNVAVLKTITLQAFNGTTPVGSPVAAGNLINLDLLGLFSNSAAFPVYFTPGAPFDRIKISIDNTLNIGGNILSGGLRINEVQRTVARPLFGGGLNGALALCPGSTVALTAQNANTAFTYNFYKKDNATKIVTQVALANAGTYSEPNIVPGSYTYYIAAQKAGCTGESDRDSVQVTVNTPVVFNATTLAHGTATVAYSKQVTPATGGTPVYTYTLATGSTLPVGLSISTAGAITGIPTTAGTYTFSLVATDAIGCKTTAVYTLVINGALTLPTATLPNGMAGKVYPPITLPSPTGGSTPYVFSSANLPGGLSLDPNTGTITGTPTTAGAYTFTVTATDADGNVVNTNFNLTVRPTLALTAATLSDGTIGKVYQTQIIPAATGGSGVYTYAATGLPAGLSFNTTTREIIGTPTGPAGTATVQVTVTDTEGNSATLGYSLIVRDPLVLAAGTLPNGTINVPYASSPIPAATGGSGGYIYSATGLPAVLTFDPITRIVAGVPTQSGNFTVNIKVTDNTGTSITVPYALNISGILVLPTASLPTGTVGVTYTSPALPVVTGGTSPYIYSVATGTLPAGITFDASTRVLSGTPTAGGVFNVAMTATDLNGIATTTVYPLNIIVGTPSIAGTTICAGGTATLSVNNPVTGVNYNFYSATGNTPLVTGNTYTTGALTTTATYYVEAVSGSAVSARIPVIVTVNPAPDAPVVTTNNLTITSGQTATLRATASAGSTVNWYATATGGIALATGETFTTGALTANTTYYAAAVNNTTGCVSLTRVPVIITVTGIDPNVNCNAANSQQSGLSSILCVGCTIQGAGNSTDADPTNFTQLTVPVGLGASAYQQLIFQRAGVATDSVRVDLETPTGLLDVTALGGITVNILNGNTVVKSYPLNQSLINLRLLTGNRFKATFAATGAYDRVEVRFSPVLAVLSNVNIYGAQVIFPNPVAVSGNQTVCSGSTASLEVTPQGGTTVAWYAAATGGTALSTQNTFTTPALTATTTYYIEVSKNGCVNPTRVPVVVTVTPAVAVPVIVPATVVCAGFTTSLSVDNPQAGITYRWYDSTTATTPLFTGPVYTTLALTANTTYYVEAVNGNCVSPTRASVAVTVSPLPILPKVTASATTVTSGQTVKLSATSTETDVTFKWYDSANATTPVFTGSDFVTPPLTMTTSYYVEASSTITGCASSSRVQQTITVSGPGTPLPVLCEAPVSQTTGNTGGIVLLARVDNPDLVLDGDQHTGSTLSVPVGLLGGGIYQRVQFTGLSNVGDTVQVRLKGVDRLLALSLLGNTTVTTYNGGTSNNDAQALNNPLLNIQLLSTGNELLFTYVPTAQFDGVQVTLNSGAVGLLSAINFNSARRITVAPTVAAASVTACTGQPATLTVTNPQPGIVYKWYSADGTYQQNADGVTFVTPAITGDTQYFVEANRAGCGGSRTTIKVTAVPAPVTPVLLAPTVNTCLGSSVVLTVQNPQTGATYNWYNNGILVPGQTTASLTIPSVLANTTYTVEAVNSCLVASAQTTVQIVVGNLSAPVVAPTAITINSGEQTILTASSATAGVTYKWYTDAGLTNQVSTTLNGENGTFITGPLTSTTIYYVTVQSTLCSSTATAVTVTVNPTPTDPTQVACEAATTQTIGSGGLLAGLTTVSNPGFAVDNLTATSSSLFVPVGVGTFVTQRVTFPGGTSLPGDKVKLGISSPAALLTLAIGQTITVTTYNGGISNADELTLSNPLITLQLLTGQKDGTVEFTPTKPFDAVELKLSSGLLGALTAVNFNYAQRIQVPPTVVAAAVTVCEGTTANLEVSNPAASGVIYNWTDDANSVFPPGATLALPTTLAPGVYNYYVTASRNGCPSARTQVVVTVTPTPATPVPTAANPATTCLNTPVILGVDQVSDVTYNWYDAATGGNLLASNTNTYTTPANLPVGISRFYVEAVNSNSCASVAARAVVAITVKPASTVADLTVTGAGTAVCAGSSVTLTATSTLTNPVFTWYSNAALTNAVFTGPAFTINPVTANITYYVSVRGDEKCDNTSGTGLAVDLKVNPPATPADVTVTGVPASVCTGTAVTLTATSATVTAPVFTWYSDAALTTVVPSVNGVLTIPTLTATTTYYVTVRGTNRCENVSGNANAVTIVVNPPATAADITVSGIPASLCSGTGAILTATSTTVINPVFTWYSDAALTTAIPSVNGVLTVQPLTATTTYYVTVSGLNKCENTAATAQAVVLTVNPVLVFADATLANGTEGIAYGQQLPAPTGGTAPYTYALSAGSTLPNGLALSAGGIVWGTPATAGQYTFTVTATDSKGCSANANFTLTIDNATPGLALPTAPLADGVVGTVYTSQTIPAATGGTPGYTYIATGIPAGLQFDPVTRQITGTPTLGGSFPIVVTVTDAANQTATGNYNINVTVPAPAVANAQTCAGNNVTLTVSNPIANVTYNWYAAATGGTSLQQGITFQTGAVNATTIYYAEATSGTAVSTRTAVTVTVTPAPTAADITVAGVPATVCSASTATLTATSTTISNPVFTWYSDAALTTVVPSANGVFTTPALTQDATYYVTVKSGTNGCENTTSTAKAVTLTVNPALVFNGTTLPVATTANAYNTQLIAATGGTAPYTYSVAAGSTLPDGLSLSAAGVLSGTPITAGNYTFVITVTDSKGCNLSGNFSIAVGTTPPAITLPAAPLADGEVGTVYTVQTIPAPIGGTAPYTYTATGLPPGLLLDPVTREITGTPTLGGLFPIIVTVTDANNATAPGNYNIRVTVPAPIAAGTQTCAGNPVTLTVSSPVPNVTYNWYAAANGGASLQLGTTFQTGAINATTTYYVEASSGTAVSLRTPVMITVTPAPTAADITVAGIPATVCSGSGVTLTATSSTITNPIFTWYSDAALTTVVPSANGVFTTPVLTQGATYYVTVQSGTNGCANTVGTAKAVVLNVNPALVFNGGALPTAATANAYSSQLLPATGGTPGYTYSITPGSTLPLGLSLSPAGLLSGLPVALGDFTFSLTATDSKGCSAAANFSLRVGLLPLVMSLPPAALPDGQVGTNYPAQFIPQPIGGTAPYTYTATNVPNGLNFDPATRAISGTPSLGGTFQINVTVTDANGLTASQTYPITVTVGAPVVAGVQSCGGNSVTLTVANPLTGVTYNWYANANGGTSLQQGASFQTGAVTATTTYYAEASSGTAVSTRTAAMVTVKPTATAADVTVANIPSAVCAGSGASLTATSGTLTNPVFTWYSDAALTTVVPSVNGVLTTPVLTQNTTYYVTVQNANTCQNAAGSARAVVLVVNPALVFNDATLPAAAIASVYNAQLAAATGGTPGYTYSVTSGSTLPNGLSLSASGLLSGTPAAVGSYTFSLTVTDSKGCSAAANFSLNVGTGTTSMTLPPASLPNGQVGTPYPAQTLPAPVGGTAPYTYTATGLPAGLQFDPSTRTITGAPGLGGTFTVHVIVTDANGGTAAQDYVIVVTVPAPIVAAAQACAGSTATLTVTNPVSGVTYNWYAVATGGTALNQGVTFQTPAVTATTTYYVEGVSGTATSGRIAVSVTVSSALAAPVVTVQSTTAIGITFAWNNVTGATGYEVSTDGGSTWQSPTSGPAGTTHTILGLQANASVTLKVRALGSTVCATSAAGSVTGTVGSITSNDVFIPNTFTPNGDGKNDIFYVYGNAIAKVRMRVYNQWGQFIYESLQVQSGWDGTYRGQLQPNGVYVYYVDITFTDGTTALKKGSVTLLR